MNEPVKKSNKKTWLYVFLAVVVTLVLRHVLDTRRTFDVVTVNRDAGVLDRVRTTFEGYSFSVGILTPRTNGLNEATFGGHFGPWPKTLEVSWIEENHPEKVYKKQLSVPPPLRLRYGEDLDLVVEFKGGSVSAFPRAVDSRRGVKYRYAD
jgi:hypothetical protein